MLSREEQEKLCHEAMVKISDEINKEQNTDHFKAMFINTVIGKACALFLTPLLFTSVLIYCGLIGKIAFALYIINNIAGHLVILQKRAMHKRVEKMVKKQSEELKNKGVEVDFESLFM